MRGGAGISAERHNKVSKEKQAPWVKTCRHFCADPDLNESDASGARNGCLGFVLPPLMPKQLAHLNVQAMQRTRGLPVLAAPDLTNKPLN